MSDDEPPRSLLTAPAAGAMLRAMPTDSRRSKEWPVEEVDLSSLLDFIRAGEVALVYADNLGLSPSELVLSKLSQEHKAVRVGRLAAASLVRAPQGLRELLGPQLRAHGISELWLPSGYYLFFRGELIGYRDPGVPTTMKEFLPTLLIGGLAVLERLATKRWGGFTRLLPTAIDLTMTADTAAYLGALLRDAVNGTRREDGPSKARPKGPEARERPSKNQGPDAPPPEPWPKDPYAVLGLTKSATYEEIKRAYRKATSRFHPDKAKDENDRLLREGWQKHLNLAYQTLRDARGP